MNQITPTGSTITLIHFVFTEAGEPERLACMPNMVELHRTPYHPHYQRTNSFRAVTCPACKRSDVFRGATSRGT